MAVVASGSLAALLPPPHLRSLLEIYLCTVLGIVHCILTGPAEAAFAPHSGVAAKFPRKKTLRQDVLTLAFIIFKITVIITYGSYPIFQQFVRTLRL